jgi:DNA-binding MarR family transcriptional regulator/GNAT superfamily N-acetyltransferase
MAADDGAGAEASGVDTADTAGTVDEVAEVRAFNRFYTARIGVLGAGLLDTPYSLTEARVLFELAHGDGGEVTALRRVLGLDAGYLSRILTRFTRAGLVTRERSAADRRRQVVRLTDAGRETFRTLDIRSAREVRDLVAPVSGADRGRLLAAMRTIRAVLDPARQPDRARGEAGDGVVLREPRPGDLGWVVQRHGELYASEYDWDRDFETLVARIVADFAERADPDRERAWIAEVDGERAGSVFCMRSTERTARLRLLLVEPAARGRGVGTRLVDACLEFARQAGYTEMVLWTNDVLRHARRVYERAGFELVSEGAHHAFGHDLVEQTWRRPL